MINKSKKGNALKRRNKTERMTEEHEEKVSLKVPVFDGRKSKWPVFKRKFRTCLAAKELTPLLLNNDPIIKDQKVHTEEELKVEANKTKSKMRSMNNKAAGLLLNCVDTSADLGGKTQT